MHACANAPASASVRPPVESLPPVSVPAGYIGPVALKGTGRMIWWTGRVAIGLRHEPPRPAQAATDSEQWLQDLLASDATGIRH